MHTKHNVARFCASLGASRAISAGSLNVLRNFSDQAHQAPTILVFTLRDRKVENTRHLHDSPEATNRNVNYHILDLIQHIEIANLPIAVLGGLTITVVARVAGGD